MTEKFARAMDVTITKYRSHHKAVPIISTNYESVLKSDQLAQHLSDKGAMVALRIPYEHEKTRRCLTLKVMPNDSRHVV